MSPILAIKAGVHFTKHFKAKIFISSIQLRLKMFSETGIMFLSSVQRQPCGRVVGASYFGSGAMGMSLPGSEILSEPNKASLHRALYNYPPIILI